MPCELGAEAHGGVGELGGVVVGETVGLAVPDGVVLADDEGLGVVGVVVVVAVTVDGDGLGVVVLVGDAADMLTVSSHTSHPQPEPRENPVLTVNGANKRSVSLGT